LPDDGFSLQLKHVTRNKTDANLVVVDSFCFPFYCTHSILYPSSFRLPKNWNNEMHISENHP